MRPDDVDGPMVENRDRGKFAWSCKFSHLPDSGAHKRQIVTFWTDRFLSVQAKSSGIGVRSPLDAILQADR